MASLPLSQQEVVGEYFGDAQVPVDTTHAKHRQAMKDQGFNRAQLGQTDWVELLMDRQHFSRVASRHSLWLLSPMELGIEQAADLTYVPDEGEDDLTNVRDGGEDDLFIPYFYGLAAADGFLPCMPDVLGGAAELFAESDLPRLSLAHQAVKDSGGGLSVLTFSRRQGDVLWVSVMRWHPAIQHLLSCESPWLFCRAD